MYYLCRKKEVWFFDNENQSQTKSWIKKLVKQGKISKAPPIEYVYECYGIALDNLDKFYDYLIGNSALVREMIRIYEDEGIGLAYKKEFTRDLSKFYYIDLYLHNEESQLGDGERILFIPCEYRKFLKTAKKTGAFYRKYKKIDIVFDLRIYHGIGAFYRKIRSWLFQLGTIVYYLIKVASGGGNGQTNDYCYAIPVINPDYQFKFDNRQVDFLLDGNEINKDNTIFLILNPSITNDNWNEMKSKNLRMLDCSKRFTLYPGFSWGEKLRILKKVLSYSIKSIFVGLFEHRLVLDVHNVLLPVFFKWSSILRKATFKHFITLNDAGIDHIGRNILLNKSGAKTWYYAHSASLGYLRILPRHWLWSFLCYDYYVSWNDQMIEYYQLHPQKIDNYLSIGCLWSQSIVDILEGRLTSSLSRNIFTDFKRYNHRTLSFFDSSYVPNSPSPLEDGVAFYRSILKLLEEVPDILVIVKEKKPEQEVLQVYQNFGGTNEVFTEQYKPALYELRRHPRCYLTGYQGDPSEIIAMSDLTITYALSSSTVEALCAGKKAIFFDPGNRWSGCYYDGIPDFIAHSYDELKRLIQKWLYETTDEEYRYFLNTYIKGEMDPYMDGKAITRFRELLAR